MEKEISPKHLCYKMGEDFLRNADTGDISGLLYQTFFIKDMRKKGLDSFTIEKINEIKRFFKNSKIDYIEEYNKEIIPIEKVRGYTLGKAVNFLCHNETI